MMHDTTATIRQMSREKLFNRAIQVLFVTHFYRPSATVSKIAVIVFVT